MFAGVPTCPDRHQLPGRVPPSLAEPLVDVPSGREWFLGRRPRSLTGLELRPRSSHLALLVVAFVVAGLGLLSSPASAHSGKQSYLYVSLFDDGVEGRVEIPAVDLGPAIGVDLVGFPGGLDAGVAAEGEALQMLKHIGLKPSWKRPLKTGGLDGRLAKFEMY